MDREVIWSLAAGNDLVAIAEYISRDSDAYSAAVVREIVTAARSLRTFAERGRRVPEYDDPQVRELIVRKTYRLIYRVHAKRVEVVRIMHGARELPDN